MNKLLLLVILLNSLEAFAQTNSSDFSNLEKAKYESEIKLRIGIQDTIDILKVEYFEYDSGYLFLVNNKNSRYNYSLGVGIESQPLDIYNSSYEHWINKIRSKSIDNTLLEDFVGDWIPIYKRKGQFAFYYTYCNHSFEGYTISDSTIVNYYMDGPGPDVIDSVFQQQNSIVISTINGGNYEFLETDSDKRVFILSNGRSKRYLTKEINKTSFPVIVELCHELGIKLTDFEPVNVSK